MEPNERPIDDVVEQIDKLADGSPVPATEPRVPVKTALELTREQEDRLVQHCINTIEQLKESLGRDSAHSYVTGGNHGDAQGLQSMGFGNPASEAQGARRARLRFLERCAKYTRNYEMDYSDREMPNTIYEHSNLAGSQSQRATLQMSGKTKAKLFPNDNFLNVRPIGIEDKDIARAVKERARYVADEMELVNALMDGIDGAYIRGQAVMKVAYETDSTLYERKGIYLADAQGNAVFDAAGDYIWKQNVGADQVYPGNQLSDGTIIPDGAQWIDGKVSVRDVRYSGPVVSEIHYLDFLCSDTDKDVSRAAFVAHLYEDDAMRIAEKIAEKDIATAVNEEDRVIALKQAQAAILNLSNDGNEYKTGARTAQQGRQHSREFTDAAPQGTSVSEIGECWMRYDANGDGRAEEILCIVHLPSQTPLFYDYLQNVQVDRKRPFEVIRPRGRSHSWTGIGTMEYMDPEQEFGDLVLNRWNYGIGATGGITFWNPKATIEGRMNQALELNGGKTYTKADPEMPAENIVDRVQLVDTEHLAQLKEIYVMNQQQMTLKNGSINAADETINTMNSTRTATGINSLENQADEQFTNWVKDIQSAVRRICKRIVKMMFLPGEKAELVRFYDRQQDRDIAVSLTPDMLRELDVDVRISISDDDENAEIVKSDEATAITNEFYTAVPAEIQPVVAEQYRERLRRRGIRDAEKYIVPPAPPEPGVDTGDGGEMVAQPPPMAPEEPPPTGRGIDQP